MSHLHPERLAALADGEPTAAEATHLSSCPSCAREIAAHRRLLMLAWQERDALTAPLTSWETISAAARQEGLLRDEARPAAQWAPGARAHEATGSRLPWWLQAAAAVAILVGGMAIGRSSLPQPVAQAPSDAQFVSNTDSTIAFRSTAEAISVLARAERDYRMAMMYLAGQDTVSRAADDPDIYRARLAVLDEMADVTLTAVHRAPQDPLMNRLYLNTLGVRDATLRQLEAKLPGNARLASF
jgi:hypothetical protein